MTRTPLAVAGVAAAICGSAFLWMLSPRTSALLVFVVLLLAVATFSRHRSKSAVVGMWGLYVLALFVPIDIGFDPRPGFSPRVVPVLYGLPGPEAFDLEAKGEVWLGGCVVLPNSPKWMIFL